MHVHVVSINSKSLPLCEESLSRPFTFCELIECSNCQFIYVQDYDVRNKVIESRRMEYLLGKMSIIRQIQKKKDVMSN